jgi:MFS family permease
MRYGFQLLLAAAFLWGCGSSQLTLLAVVLNTHGMSAAEIAAVASMLTVSQIVSSIVSGTLAARHGAIRTVWLGATVAITGIAILPFTLDSVAGNALGNFIRGFGFGMLLPAGQMFTQSQAPESDRSRAVAIFSAMFLIPAFFGPALGEAALTGFGEDSFFVLVVLPMALALALVLLLPRHLEAPTPPNTSGYLSLLRDRRLWLPNLATMQGGLAYTFAWTFLPLLLIGFTSVAAFFTPFAVSLIATRFVGMKYLQRLPPAQLVTFGLGAYLAGLMMLVLSATGAVAIVTGVLFGFAYGVTTPSCIEWSTRLYPGNRRPVALINTSFHIGAIIALQLTGVLLMLAGWTSVLIALAALVCCVLVPLLARQLLAATTVESVPS